MAQDEGEANGRWPEVKARFEELAGLDAAARAARLAGLRATDPALAAEVDSLLAHDHTGGFLDPPADIAALLGHSPRERIGPWRLERVIGHGGMGVVFEATRADQAYEQRVAVKLVSGAWARPGLRERLAAERRILAALDHPGIARLIDGGETRAGNPYLVMELVEGTPITRHAAERALAPGRRLELVAAALEAVQFAHERLIVHRDLKPSNVLVTATGQVKLLDFGIARAMSGDAAPGEATRVFTPGYASPEQVRGEPPAAAADVYSMGVILYELVAGSHPYRDRDRWVDAMLAADPEKPSRRLAQSDPAAPPVAAELDAIVMKALARDPAERYPTARDLRDDLLAFLGHRPISVRRPSPLYLAAKFARRHPSGTALAAAALAAILSTSVVAIVLAERAERAREDSERRFEEVRRLANDVVFSYQDALEPLGGQALDVRLRLIRDGLAYLDRLTASPNVSAGLLREAAAGYQRIGDLLGNFTRANLGQSPEAMASYAKARALREKLHAANPGDASDAVALASVLQAIGRARLAVGEIAPAKEAFAQAERLMAAHARPEDRAAHLVLRLEAAGAQSCASIGYGGDSRPALAAVAALEPEFRALLAARRSSRELDANVSYLLAAGALAGCTGDVARAVAAFEAAEPLTRELRDLDPYDVTALHRRAMILLELGYWRAVAGDAAAGIERMEDARDILESLYASNRRDAKLRLDLATVYSKLGGLQVGAGALEEAASGARRAEAVLQTLLAEAPANRTFHTLLAAAYNRQAQVAFARGRHAEALRLANLAVAELRTAGTGDTSRIGHLAMVLNYRATIESAAGLKDAAAATRLESAALARRATAENPAAVDLRIALATALVALAEEAPRGTLRAAGLGRREASREALGLLEDLARGGRLPPAARGLLARAAAAARGS